MKNKICIWDSEADFEIKEGTYCFKGAIYCDRFGDDLDLEGQFYFTDEDGDEWPCKDIFDAEQLVDALGIDIYLQLSEHDFDMKSYRSDMD